jgi:hypothetical protein
MELSFQDWIENIIDDLTQNGVMDPGRLYEPPSTDSHPEGLDGVFRDDDADQIISLVRSFNETVESQFGARDSDLSCGKGNRSDGAVYLLLLYRWAVVAYPH